MKLKTGGNIYLIVTHVFHMVSVTRTVTVYELKSRQ